MYSIKKALEGARQFQWQYPAVEMASVSSSFTFLHWNEYCSTSTVENEHACGNPASV